MELLPSGTGLALDGRLLRFRSGTVLAGGHPGRVITLTPEGAAALDRFVAGGTPDSAVRALAARLVAAGMAHPRRWVRGDRAGGPTSTGANDGTRAEGSHTVSVVVPVRDRPDDLDRCLTALGPQVAVVVVDDASADPGSVARVCDARGATLVRRTVNGGPAAARLDGVSHSDGDLVAFVDSDCIVGPGWLDDLTWLFDDPMVGAVAPRVRAATRAGHAGRTAIDRFDASHSPLDLGPEEGDVGPGRVVRYVPTAALVVRRKALDSVDSFDTGLRVGEDVDLVWRLVEAGWRVRYVPQVHVSHLEPDRWSSLFARRVRYGTSAGPLALRHPGALAPVELRLVPTLVALTVLCGRPRTAAVGVGVSAAMLARSVRPLGIPGHQAVRWSLQGVGWTVVGLGRTATMLGAPGLVALALGGRRSRRAALALVLVPPMVDWFRRRPDLDPVRWTVASVVDDLAYGLGVWLGCIGSRTIGPLRPSFRLRSTGS